MKVLLVEDEPVARETIKLFLQTKSLDVYEAEGGRQAVIEAMRLEPDVVLMDLIMPDMSGTEAISIIKSMRRSKPVTLLALTGSDKTDLHDEALQAGADQVLRKPFNPDDFVAAIGMP